MSQARAIAGAFLCLALTALLAGRSAEAQNSILTGIDGGQPAADVQAEALTLEELRQLAQEYHCDAGAAPLELDGGWELQSHDRVARNACIATRETAEVFAWRAMADAGALTPAPSGNVTIHEIAGIVVVVGAAFDAYANNRTARHLGLWP